MKVRPLHFGIQAPTTTRGVEMPEPELVYEFTTYAEKVGFDSAWVFDHIAYPHRILDALTTLGALGAITSKMRLGTDILMLPMRNPLIVAKEVASLDYMTRGRIDLGVAIGGGLENLEVWGMSTRERIERLREGIQVLRTIWKENSASYSGAYYQFDGVTVKPRPVQRPCPPIWVGGRGKSALKTAALLSDGYLGSYQHTPRECKQDWREIKRYARDARRNLADFRFGLNLFTYVAKSDEAAKRASESFLTKYYRMPYDEILRTQGVAVGTAKAVSRRLKKYVEAGADTLIFMTATFEIEQLDVHMNEVIPSLERR